MNNPKLKAGVEEYRNFVNEYKSKNPGVNTEIIRKEWHNQRGTVYKPRRKVVQKSIYREIVETPVSQETKMVKKVVRKPVKKAVKKVAGMKGGVIKNVRKTVKKNFVDEIV